MEKFDFDVAIIGGGSAGYATARTTSAAGKRTVVIDGSEALGGLCILRGCMPTKALLHAADVRFQSKRSNIWGIDSGEIGFDFGKVMQRKADMVEEFASYRRDQLQDGRFELIRGTAQFRDPYMLDISNGQSITAKKIMISSGSRVADLPLPELSNLGCITSDDALELKSLPKSIIVLGGGAVALEFAQFFARFDVEVTVLQRSPHVLSDFDEDSGIEIEAALRNEGITVHTGCKISAARNEGETKVVVFEQAKKILEVQAEMVFHGLGRSSNTETLSLENAGVETERGRIISSPQMQTSMPHIFAGGDCTGPHEIVHIAVQQGEVAAHNILNPDSPKAMDYRLLTSVVFTDPHAAVVGLTEKQAKEQGISYKAASYPFNDHGKSIIMEAMHGFVKLLCDPKSGEILGGACIGPMGGELIHEIVIAMAKRMTVAELAAIPHYHPTLAEIWTYPAEDLAEEVSG
ncbi:MAG: NAD(P)/FAD-dependent oxidoreductase [Limisphaerales bacterium]|nr:MAG: NAD(P)/FAD-dependent oxidoreductase [Limisphaerales bacterium]